MDTGILYEFLCDNFSKAYKVETINCGSNYNYKQCGFNFKKMYKAIRFSVPDLGGILGSAGLVGGGALNEF